MSLDVLNYFIKKGTTCFALKEEMEWERPNFKQRKIPLDLILYPEQVFIDPEDVPGFYRCEIIKQISQKGYYVFDYTEFTFRNSYTEGWLVVLIHKNDINIDYIDRYSEHENGIL